MYVIDAIGNKIEIENGIEYKIIPTKFDGIGCGEADVRVKFDIENRNVTFFSKGRWGNWIKINNNIYLQGFIKYPCHQFVVECNLSKEDVL